MASERLRQLAEKYGLSVELQAELAQLLLSHRGEPTRMGSSARRTLPLDENTEVPAWSPTVPYQDQGMLGRGAMGEVRKVFDSDLQRTVAMKILHTDLPLLAVNRFIEEAQLTAQLQHPSIVPVHAFGQRPDGRYFFTMRRVQGRNLHQRIQLLHAGMGSHRRLLDAFAVACEAVGYAHAKRVVHRDLKPSNIMVGTHGQVVVVDWGLARSLDAPATREVVGTPGFMAPECARGEVAAVGPPADVYALGATLYQLLTGARPFAGRSVDDTLQDTLTAPPPRPERPAESPVPIPIALADLVQRCLAKDPADRPADAAEVAAELRAWQDGVRRRDRGTALVEEAKKLRADAERAEAEATKLRTDAAALACPSTAPVSEKLPGWRLHDQALQLTHDATLSRSRYQQLLQGALTMDPDHPEAHAGLAELAAAAHRQAERAGDRAAAQAAELVLQAHDRAGVYSDYLRGSGRIELATTTPAEATLFRFELRDRRLIPVLHRHLGPTPVEHTLPHGSWLLTLRPPSGPVVRLPILVERLGRWTPSPPGVEQVLAIQLPDTLGKNECFVPPGVFIAGGDASVPCLPRQQVWVDGFVIERYTITNRRYIQFLDALVAEGREAEALAYCPRVHGGDRIYGRTESGGFVLQPDADGDLWRPDDPVVLVDFLCARAFAAYEAKRTGLPWRLPTEYEWEKAARGVDGRAYPWGEHPDPTWMCIRTSHVGPARPPQVHEFPGDESPYGVRGMAGGVRDWCTDVGDHAGPVLHHGCNVIPAAEALEGEQPRAYRGGDWYGLAKHARLAYRAWNKPQTRNYSLGFRLVRSLPSGLC